LEIRAGYEMMCKHIVEPGKSQVTIWRMGIACCIPKATITPSEYAVLPLQQWLHERASLLLYTYFTCRC